MKVIIDADLLDGIAEYLTTQPYRHVANFIERLKVELQNQPKAAAAPPQPPPADEVKD